MAGAMTRRSALGTFGAVGAALATGTLSIGTPARAQAQGQSQALGLQESVQDGLKRVFGGRPMKDGTALIKLDIPPIAENGAVVPVSVEVNAPMTPASYVKNIWIVADNNRIPIVARATPTPDAGQAFLGASNRLGAPTDVRAIVAGEGGGSGGPPDIAVAWAGRAIRPAPALGRRGAAGHRMRARRERVHARRVARVDLARHSGGARGGEGRPRRHAYRRALQGLDHARLRRLPHLRVR